MKEKLSYNAGILKEKDLLDKLSIEISRDFSLGEKLTKKLIYKTHSSLEELKKEINLEFKNSSGNLYNENFDDKKLDKLFSVLKGARELIENSSKTKINQLKELLEFGDTEFLIDDSKIIKKLLSDQIIIRAKNPQNISDNIMGISLGILNFSLGIVEILYGLGKGIITIIPDLISIVRGRSEIESLKKI